MFFICLPLWWRRQSIEPEQLDCEASVARCERSRTKWSRLSVEGLVQLERERDDTRWRRQLPEANLGLRFNIVREFPPPCPHRHSTSLCGILPRKGRRACWLGAGLDPHDGHIAKCSGQLALDDAPKRRARACIRRGPNRIDNPEHAAEVFGMQHAEPVKGQTDGGRASLHGKAVGRVGVDLERACVGERNASLTLFDPVRESRPLARLPLHTEQVLAGAGKPKINPTLHMVPRCTRHVLKYREVSPLRGLQGHQAASRRGEGGATNSEQGEEGPGKLPPMDLAEDSPQQWATDEPHNREPGEYEQQPPAGGDRLSNRFTDDFIGEFDECRRRSCRDALCHGDAILSGTRGIAAASEHRVPEHGGGGQGASGRLVDSKLQEGWRGHVEPDDGQPAESNRPGDGEGAAVRKRQHGMPRSRFFAVRCWTEGTNWHGDASRGLEVIWRDEWGDAVTRDMRGGRRPWQEIPPRSLALPESPRIPRCWQ